MTRRDEMIGNLPLQYFDGPYYCTVKDATGGDFALTVQPDLMKVMEDALRSAQAEPGYVAGFEACRAFVAAFGQSLDDDFGFWSSPTSDVVRSKLYSLWAKANAQAALPAPAGESVTEEELAKWLLNNLTLSADHVTDARTIRAAFTITRKSWGGSDS